MTDFRQLALEFVLADGEAQQTTIAKKAAHEIQTSPSNSNPLARWVEAVQPWMPGSSNEAEDGGETPDWTARAKALEFLSRTLDFVGKDVLKPSQVKLLVSFFGAMFDVDHKAGIQPSASALTRIAAMKSFQWQFGNQILEKICALKDDFPRQVSKTRLAVYQLIYLLISTPEIASDLQNRHGASAGFMIDLLHLCRSERDPECLMVWFEIITVFLSQFTPSREVLDEVYGTFKPYFPIALPRASQAGIAPEDLKLQLRKCFSANHLLSENTFPFLLGKLDQGDGVTVNVKLDILKTIRACLEEYTHVEKSIAPFANQIWGSLKYEVRNGEIEDTIWSTLEVLKALTMRLTGDNLRDYSLAVTRDCVTDLANPTYTASSGRLLVSVLSAKPSAFVLMVAPIMTHIKDNLRHPKAPVHGQDLLKILHVILETRLLLVDTEMSAEDREDLAAVDTFFLSLNDEVYKNTVQLGSKPDASYDHIKMATQAVQGAGALVCQRPAKSQDVSGGATSARLLPERECSEICKALFDIVSASGPGYPRSTGRDELVDDTMKALQRAIRAFPFGFEPLIDEAQKLVRSSWQSSDVSDAVEAITTLGNMVAFVGSSELPATPLSGFGHFVYSIRVFITELYAALDSMASPQIWCALVATLQSVVRYFNDACQATHSNSDSVFSIESLDQVSERYPELSQPGNSHGPQSSMSPTSSVDEIRSEFLLVSLFVTQQLYKRATKTVECHPQTGKPALTLSNDFTGTEQASEYQYLHLVSALAGVVVHEMSESQQLSLRVERHAISLFRADFIGLPETTPDEINSQGFEKSILERGSAWRWLVLEQPNILSLGIIETLRPSVVARLFENGVAQQVILSGLTAGAEDSFSRPVTLSILTALANKYKIETLPGLIAALELHATGLLDPSQAQENDATRLEQITTIYALAAGMLRRYSGKEAKELLEIVKTSPKDPKIGSELGRRLEMIVAPQQPLSKENYAIVKPLWLQRVYFQLVSPMLEAANGQDAQVQDQQIKANFGTGVLLMVKHMNFTIYEADSDKILRIAIASAQKNEIGPDTKAALDVLKNTLIEAPEKGKDHLRSIIKICVAVFSTQPSATTIDAEVEGGCGKLALEITGGLPRMYESRHLIPHVPQVQRELTLACGHRVRNLRKTARLARAAWADLK